VSAEKPVSYLDEGFFHQTAELLICSLSECLDLSVELFVTSRESLSENCFEFLSARKKPLLLW
jgi:hypothetical protein